MEAPAPESTREATRPTRPLVKPVPVDIEELDWDLQPTRRHEEAAPVADERDEEPRGASGQSDIVSERPSNGDVPTTAAVDRAHPGSHPGRADYADHSSRDGGAEEAGGRRGAGDPPRRRVESPRERGRADL